MFVLRPLIGLLLVGAMFAALERWYRGRPKGPRPQRGLDVAWFLVGSLVVRPATVVAVLPAFVLLAVATGTTAETGLLDGFGPIAALPWAARVILSLILLDFTGYWLHRAFHRGRLWPIHAVHHSSTRVDWLASVRVHPVGTLARRGAQAVPFLLLGFPAETLATAAPLLGLYAVLLHAEVPWRLGPLRRVIASPAFHRWHHGTDGPRGGCNFGGLFAVWDVWFGTYCLEDRVPSVYGTGDHVVPGTLVGQLLHPWRPRVRAPSEGPTGLP